MHNGLTILQDPPGSIVDIVFVHGLQRDGDEAWTTEDGVSWPRDLLPADVDKSRIISFKYDAEIEHFWSPSQGKLDKHARNLSDSLFKLRAGASPASVREGSNPNPIASFVLLGKNKNKKLTVSHQNTRPVIFVAHSLGGLVSAQALAFASNGPRRRICEDTIGIMTFGTPFAGSDPARWLQVGGSFFDYLGRDCPEDLADQCETLSRLGKKFQDLINSRVDEPTRIEVMCFFEGQDTIFQFDDSYTFKVVPEALACLDGYPSELIPTNHANMCKFTGDDAGYGKASSVLRGWVEALEERAVKEGATVVNASFSGQFFGSPAVAHARGGAKIMGGGNFHFGVANFGGHPQQGGQASAPAPNHPASRPHPAAPLSPAAPLPPAAPAARTRAAEVAGKSWTRWWLPGRG